MTGLSDGRKSFKIGLARLDTIPACDRHLASHPVVFRQQRPRLHVASRGQKLVILQSY